MTTLTTKVRRNRDRLVLAALRASQWQIPAAARKLGMQRQNLYTLLKTSPLLSPEWARITAARTRTRRLKAKLKQAKTDAVPSPG